MSKNRLGETSTPATHRTPVFAVTPCRGFSSCPRALADPVAGEISTTRIEELLAAHQPAAQNPAGPARPFTVSLSLCPNGCSRPQIADIGVIARSYPEINNNLCNRCGACIIACREQAIITNNEGRPGIHETCIGCGDCFDSCPTGALVHGSRKGFQVSVGGRLGRHPRLGEDMGKLYSSSQVLDLIARIYTWWLREKNPGERLGDLIQRKGLL